MVDISSFAEVAQNLEGQIAGYSLKSVGLASLLIIMLVITGMQIKQHKPKYSLHVFLLITAIVGSTTVFLFGSTIYLNSVSDSNGPVHWHADIEYWVCGSEIELRDPYRLLSNKIGTASLHEHNDKRIHLEGVVVNEHEDATLGNFMHVIDGNLERGSMTIPVGQNNLFEDDQDGDIVDTSNRTYIESMVRGSGNARYLDLMNGESCSGNADAQPAEVQVFVYRFDKDNDTYSQTKLDDPANYVYSPYSNVPPGDCIIFEFDSPKDFTDKLCLQYGLKDTKRCVEFGVPANEPEHCNITDTTDYTKLSEQAGVDVQEAPSSQSDSTERSN